MDRRQPLPQLWMMTDERQGERLLPAVRALPSGAGIVFRHYSLSGAERRRLFEAVREIARAPDVVVLLAGAPDIAAAWGAHGSHGWEGAPAPGLIRSVSVHDAAEMQAANALKADLAFVSPIFATRSHPGKAALGPEALGALAAQATMPVIALGGMNEARADDLAQLGIYGWAGIDALTPD